MITLQNEWIKLCLNKKGALTHLENLKGGCGNVIAAPAEGLFRAVFHSGENWEDVAFASAQDYAIQASGDAATLTVKGLRTRDAVHDVTLTLRVALRGEQVLFTGEIDSRADATLNDLYYPCVGRLKTLGRGKPDLLLPEQAGRRYTNICDCVAVDETQNGVSVMSIAYPGMASMSFMMLEDGDQCLYLGSHDALFHAASMCVAGSEAADVSLEMDRMVFVRKGERFDLPQGVLLLYQGSWHKGADVYAEWAGTWRKRPESPDWARDMTGYFLVINKQQYGDELWPYETLPELYDLAKAHGCDTLGLFGWYHTGHDNQYPDLDASPTLGGADSLRAQIKAVQARGGHVTLYYQGHLMDTGSPYYKAKGHRLEGKTRWNTPYLEEYSKYHKSEYLRRYSKKLFATVCPSCPEWHDLMAERADWIAGFGPDGMLYDQIGGMPAYPCFDESHPHLHGKPSLSYTQGRLKLLEALRGRATAHKDFGFLSEHITDLYSQYLDVLHGIGADPSAPGSLARTATADERGPEMVNYPALFRYCFPDTMITLRNPRPYLAPRVVNYAFLFGFKYEMELRYLDDQSFVREGRHAEWRAYAAQVTALRLRHRDLLLRGRYRAEAGLVNRNPAVTAAVYEGEGCRGIALWNDTDSEQKISLCMPGFRVVQWAKVDGAGQDALDCLRPGEIALLILAPE